MNITSDIILQGLFLILLFFFCRWLLKRPTKRRKFTVQEYMLVAERDGAKCRRCTSKENLTLDHIKPISKGGKYILSNYQILCRSCNSKKRDK